MKRGEQSVQFVMLNEGCGMLLLSVIFKQRLKGRRE